MRRAGTAVALTALVVMVLMRIAPSAPAVSHAAAPASPIPVSPSEVFDAVPVTMTIRNDGDEADVLLGGTTPIADLVETHTTRLIRGQRNMLREPEGLTIPAGATLVLEPGAHHLMLIDLRDALVQGGIFPLTLHFERAGEVTVRVRVHRKIDAAGLTPIPAVTVGALSVSLASAPPAPATTPRPPLPLG